MATINDLLYNYQETNEFVCSDGRMSVNGICQPAQQADSVDTSNLTETIIESSKRDGDGKDWEEKKDKVNPWDETTKAGEDKGKFEWNFDKETKIDGYKNTINNNINAYNGWVEENLGIPAGVQNAARIGGSAVALAGGTGVLGVVAPWAIPFLAGAAINKAEKERIENITDKDEQGDIHTIDMMTYNAPKPGDGINIHADGDGSDNNNTNQDKGTTDANDGFDQSSSGGYQQSHGSHHF